MERLSPKPERRLLFDVDGVLLDGEPIYVASWTAWARGHGLEPETVVAAMQGRRPADTIAEVAPHLDVNVESANLAEGLARLPTIPAMAGANDLLRALTPGQWAIFTSSREHHIRRCFQLAGLPVPTVAVFAADVTHGKPAPDGYLQAAEKLSVPPHDCVVVEDSPAGVQSGKAAGCTVVGILSTHTARDLKFADEVFPSLGAATPRLRALSGLDATARSPNLSRAEGALGVDT